MAAMRALARNRKAAVGLALLASFAALAVIGPALVGDARATVAGPHEPPSWAHPLGTTGLGQDVLAQTVVGARGTLAIAFAVGVIAVAISALVGVTAGYAGGWIDELLGLVTNVFLVIPGLPLAIVMAAFLPPGAPAMIGVLAATGWAWSARVLRAQTLTLARRDFVAAARVGGEPAARIVVREIVPNLASLLVSCFIGVTVYAIGAQVGLEFLGLGDPGAVTWGTNLYWAANDAALVLGAWWAFAPTGACVALVGFALVLVNFAIDETTNPRLAAARRFAAQTGLRAALGAVRVAPGARPAPPADPGGDAPLLSIRDLRVAYITEAGPVTAVDGVSLDVWPGEIVGLAGESGSGKSTLAAAVLRVQRPPALITGGQVWFSGRDVVAMTERELRRFRWREASMVFQSAMSALNPVATVEAQLADTIRARDARVSRRAVRARAAQLLDAVGLSHDVLRRYPHQLSGGMRQRAVIAIALALSPRLLILDEPTTALDVVVQREIVQRLQRLRDELGVAVLFITHDLQLLLEVADRVGVMYAGELVEIAPAASLAGGVRHPYTGGLLRALPRLDATGDDVAEIPGAPPRLAALPDGCRFHPRCHLAQPSCRRERPALRAIGAARIACAQLGAPERAS